MGAGWLTSRRGESSTGTVSRDRFTSHGGHKVAANIIIRADLKRCRRKRRCTTRDHIETRTVVDLDEYSKHVHSIMSRERWGPTVSTGILMIIATIRF